MNNLRLLRSNIFGFVKRNDMSARKVSPLPHNCIRFGAVSSLHTSSDCPQSTDPQANVTRPPRRKEKNPVDWLPFQWERRPRYNVLEKGGDTITELIIDLTLPKPDFELSDELKSADEEVKKFFSLQTASRTEVKEACRRQLLQRVQRHPNDHDSLEVQIALKTIQVRSLYEHRARLGRKDVMNSSVRLSILIQKRNKLLKRLRQIDNDRFCWLLEELKLFYVPNPLGDVNPPRYCKKWDLRRLTKEYCENMIADKKAAYHEELKKQQVEFLEEKKRILAWIEEEKKVLNV